MQNVLCLHGRRQCGLTFAKKLFPNCEHICEANVTVVPFPEINFIFPNAPFTSSADLPKGFKLKDPSSPRCPPSLFSWWGESPTDDGSNSLQSLATLIDTRQFVGVIGFSQGGALAASLCRSSMTSGFASPPQFAIFLSAYYPILDDAAAGPFTLPTRLRHELGVEFNQSIPRTLHCFSDRDQVVHSNKSQALLEWTKTTGERIVLEGGHAVPAIGETVLMPWIAKTKFKVNV